MVKSTELKISVVVPLFNESAGIESFHKSLIKILEQTMEISYEVIYCDDGSSDNTDTIVLSCCRIDPRIKFIKLSRNFGKENALSAGLAQATGDAVLMIDGDGQHPVELIPQFIEAWQAGAQVVVGLTGNKQNGTLKRLESKLFYKLFNIITGQKLQPGSTDFRLIDQAVRQEFMRLHESGRITRGLIDWLGFKRQYVYFNTKPRLTGTAGYSHRKLLGLAANSFVSLSPAPLFLFGYLGVLIAIASFILGAAVFIEQLVLPDPWNWNFTGTAMLGILIIFLVGVVLMSQGILSLYISHIHTQSKQRPLYIIDYSQSVGITNFHES